MPKLQEHHSKGPQWCKINTDFISWVRLYPSKMEGITNETVNKEQQAQNFDNLKYDPLKILEISYLIILVTLIYTFITLIYKT